MSVGLSPLIDRNQVYNGQSALSLVQSLIFEEIPLFYMSQHSETWLVLQDHSGACMLEYNLLIMFLCLFVGLVVCTIMRSRMYKNY
jgi:hypothetical protein